MAHASSRAASALPHAACHELRHPCMQHRPNMPNTSSDLAALTAADPFRANTQVCAACHSMQQLHFRNLVDVAYTEDEAKTMAADIEVWLVQHANCPCMLNASGAESLACRTWLERCAAARLTGCTRSSWC